MDETCSSDAQSKLTVGEYEIRFAGRELLCRNRDTEALCFRCKPVHPSIEELADLGIEKMCIAPDQRGIIVLLGPAHQGYRTVGNLVRVDLNGSVVWWAELPDSGTDNYTDITIKGSRLYAYSWNGFSCWIDERSGQIREKRFVR